MKANFNLINDYVAGALGGVGGLIAGHPLDTIKVHLQVHMSKGGARQALKEVSKYGLFLGYFRGLSFPAITQTVSSSVFFGFYGSTLALIGGGGGGGGGAGGVSGGGRSPSYGHVFLAGCSGGLLQVMFTCPAELIKVVLQSQLSSIQPPAAAGQGNLVTPRQSGHVTLNRSSHVTSEVRGMSSGGMVRYFRGPVEASVWIYRRHGLLGFYHGCWALVLRDTVTFGLYMVIYEGLHRRLMISSYTDSGGVVASLLAGGVAGVASWSSCMPVDVVKTNLQSDLDHKRYRGIVDCALQIFRRSGLRGFFAGLPVVCIRAFPVNSITFLVYSKTLSHLNRLTVEEPV